MVFSGLVGINESNEAKILAIKVALRFYGSLYVVALL